MISIHVPNSPSATEFLAQLDYAKLTQLDIKMIWTKPKPKPCKVTTPLHLNLVAKLQAIQAKIKETNLSTGLAQYMAEFETIFRAAMSERRRIDEQIVDDAEEKREERNEQSDEDDAEAWEKYEAELSEKVDDLHRRSMWDITWKKAKL